MTPQQRLIYYIDHLKNVGIVRFRKQVFDATGIRRQYYTAVKNGTARFTTEHIKAICENYPLNANWVMGTEDNMELSNSLIKTNTTRTQNHPQNKNRKYISA